MPLGRRSPEPESDRSPEERARAAAERAARRSGRPLPPPAAPSGERPGPDPAPVPEPLPAPEPEPDPAPLPDEPAAGPPAAAPPPAEEPVSFLDEPDGPPPPPPPSRHRAARGRPGPRPAPRGRSAGRTGRRTPPPRAPRRPLPPPGGKAPPRWGRRVLALLALLVVAGGLWFVNATFQPFHGEGAGAVRVSIEPGWDVQRIGDELAGRGVVDSGTFFNLNATLTGNRGDLKPGDYTLARGMSYGDAIEALVRGPKAKVVPTIDVTIPEGRSRREVVPIVRRARLEGDYMRVTGSARVLRRARRLGLPRGSDTAEGFLFPATYTLVKGTHVRDLVDKQLEAFADNLENVDLQAARRRNLTRYDVVIIASMVEREAQIDRERPLIAAVIHNRLREGIPLGIDATIRYAENNWTRPLRQSELTRPGPYNTRLNRGLPPTPIGNPGLKSLQAAAKPADEDYLYYVVKPGTCGEHAFSSTDREFQADVARYNAEREKAGGKSPTTC